MAALIVANVALPVGAILGATGHDDLHDVVDRLLVLATNFTLSRSKLSHGFFQVLKNRFHQRLRTTAIC